MGRYDCSPAVTARGRRFWGGAIGQVVCAGRGPEPGLVAFEGQGADAVGGAFG